MFFDIALCEALVKPCRSPRRHAPWRFTINIFTYVQGLLRFYLLHAYCACLIGNRRQRAHSPTGKQTVIHLFVMRAMTGGLHAGAWYRVQLEHDAYVNDCVPTLPRASKIAPKEGAYSCCSYSAHTSSFWNIIRASWRSMRWAAWMLSIHLQLHYESPCQFIFVTDILIPDFGPSSITPYTKYLPAELYARFPESR